MNTLRGARFLWLSAFSLGLVVFWSAASARSDTEPPVRPIERVQVAVNADITGDVAAVTSWAQLEIVPVLHPEGTPYPEGTQIIGNELRLPPCAEDAWFEVRIQNIGVMDGAAAAADGENDGTPAGTDCLCGGLCNDLFEQGPCAQENLAKCCTPTGCVEAGCEAHCTCLGGDGAIFTQDGECSDPPVPEDCPVEDPPVIIGSALMTSSTSRATPSPACIVGMSAREEDFLPDGVSIPDEPGRCFPKPTVEYPDMGVVRDLVFSESTPQVELFASLYLRLPLTVGCPGCWPTDTQATGAVAGVPGLEGGFDFVIDVDMESSYLRDPTGADIPFVVVPAVVTVAPVDGAPVPAVSVWGLVLIALGLLVTARIYFGRRRARTA